MTPRIYLEIGPLKEREYTGISQVTAALAAEGLGDAGRDIRFFFGRVVVARAIVEDLLHRRDGELLEWHLQRAAPLTAPEDAGPHNAAIFPNRKSCRRGFAREYQIIHDLSTLLTPHFHHRDTIEYHATTMEDDMRTNDITFCVSDATRSDVVAYFPGLDPARIVAVPIAVSLSQQDPASLPGQSVEPYILVLGTIEPRKNIVHILESISRDPAILDRYRFIFPGRFGWGDTLDNILAQFGLAPHVTSGRLVFPGYVSDAARDSLIRHAKLLIYPSLFEGFGLPVLEALAMGVPSITTRSSSLMEVGGPCAHYFDPFTEGDFERVLHEAVTATDADPARVAAECTAWSRRFSWPRTYAGLMTRIEANMRTPEI